MCITNPPDSPIDTINLPNQTQEINPQPLPNLSQRLAKRLNRNLGSLIHIERSQDKEGITLEKCISVLTKDLPSRTLDDIAVLKHYLIKSDLSMRFKLDKVSKENYDRLMVILSTYANYEFVPMEGFQYKIGDDALWLYIIIEGKASVYEAIPIIKQLDSYEYYIKLMQIKEADNKHLLNLTLKENQPMFPIELNDLDILHLILLRHKHKEMHNKKSKEDYEILFHEAKVEPKWLGIDFDKQGIFKIEDIINEQLNKITIDKVLYYKFLVYPTEKKYVTIYTYDQIDQLTTGGVFGDESFNKYLHSVLVSENTHLCKVNALLYNDQLKHEKTKSINKEISYLLECFFLTSVPRKKFEKDYFEWFTKCIYKKNQLLYNEGERINHLYFVQNGEIELSSYKSVLEMHSLLNDISKHTMNDEELGPEFDLKNMPRNIIEDLRKKTKNRLFIIINQEVLGVESWFKMPYLFTATAKSDIVEVYKISIINLREILTEWREVKEAFSLLVYDKLKLISKRLNNVNSTSISIIDSAHELDYYEETKQVNYKEKLIPRSQVVLNEKRIKEYKTASINLISNGKLGKKRGLILKKSSNYFENEIKKLTYNGSLENLQLVKKPMLLPEIKTRNSYVNKNPLSSRHNQTSFEDRLYKRLTTINQNYNNNNQTNPFSFINHLSSISQRCEDCSFEDKWNKRLQRNSNRAGDCSGQASEILKNNMKNSAGTQTILQPSSPESSAFITEITNPIQPSISRNPERKVEISLLQKSNKTLLSPLGEQRQKIYRTKIVIEKLKKYAIFNNISNSIASSKPKPREFLDDIDEPQDQSSQINSTIINSYMRKKSLEKIQEKRQHDNVRYKKKMLDQINSMSVSPNFLK